jgi:hypothetical protein
VTSPLQQTIDRAGAPSDKTGGGKLQPSSDTLGGSADTHDAKPEKAEKAEKDSSSGKGETPQTSGKRAARNKRKREAIEKTDNTCADLELQRSQLLQALILLQGTVNRISLENDFLQSLLDSHADNQEQLLQDLSAMDVEVSKISPFSQNTRISTESQL